MQEEEEQSPTERWCSKPGSINQSKELHQSIKADFIQDCGYVHKNHAIHDETGRGGKPRAPPAATTSI